MAQFHEARIIVLDILINIHYEKTKTKLTLFRYSTVRLIHFKFNKNQTPISTFLMLVKIFKNFTGDLYRLKCENLKC